jgi:hypothetical protein
MGNELKTTKGKFVQGDDFLVKQKITTPCEHKTDGAVKIAEYMVKEIQQNSQSGTAREIKYYNDWLQQVEDWQKLPWYVRLGSNPPEPTTVEALTTWALMVQTGGKWDHKLIIREKFRLYGVHRPLASGKHSESWYHKYKKHDYYLDVWSNIHYGYLGLVCGFDEATLLKGAGLMQQIDRSRDGTDTWRQGASKIYRRKWEKLDNPADQLTIKIGFMLFKKYGVKNVRKLTASDLLNALENIPKGELKDSRVIHVCYDSSQEKFTPD